MGEEVHQPNLELEVAVAEGVRHPSALEEGVALERQMAKGEVVVPRLKAMGVGAVVVVPLTEPERWGLVEVDSATGVAEEPWRSD